MKKHSKLPVLVGFLFFVACCVFCNDVGVNENLSGTVASRHKRGLEGSNGNFLRSVWRNSKKRRDVKSAKPFQTTRTKPQLECGDRVMKVILNHADVVKIQVYGPRGDPLHLSELAAFCGVSVKTTQTDVRLQFTYDSCYVKQEAAEYVLSVSWYGTDLIMSCPVSVSSPTVVCRENAMELTIVGEGTADELSVAFNGEWAPLLYVATECWKREPSSQGELTFSVPFTSCGVNFMDGHFIIDVRSKDKVTPLQCPYEPVSVFPVKDSVPMTVHSQLQPSVLHRPSSLPSTTEPLKLKPELGFEHQEGSGVKPPKIPFIHPKSNRKPKMPTLQSLLPGSFNLAVNFPFAVPLPTRHSPRPHGGHYAGKLLPTPEPPPDPTPEPYINTTPVITTPDITTPKPTLAPIAPGFQHHHALSPGFHSWQIHPLSYELQQENAAPVTEAPKLQQYPYMQFPYRFPKPPSHGKPSVPDYEHMAALVPGSAQFPALESTHNVNVPYHTQVSNLLSSLAQYLPPGYSICSSEHQQTRVPPQKFPDSNKQPAYPFQYPKPGYQNSGTQVPHHSHPGISPLAPVAPLIKEYPEPQLMSPIASTHELGTGPLQPSHYLPYNPQSSHQDSNKNNLFPGPQPVYTNLQSHASPHLYSFSPPTVPLQPQSHQKPSGQVKPHRKTTAKVPSKESRPVMQASGLAPLYSQYQTDERQYLDAIRGLGTHATGTQISSHSYQSPQSKFLYPQFRSEVLAADVSPGNTESTLPKGYLIPRSFASASLQAPDLADGGSFEAAATTLKFSPSPVFLVAGQSQVAQLPYSQGPSFKYVHNS